MDSGNPLHAPRDAFEGPQALGPDARGALGSDLDGSKSATAARVERRETPPEGGPSPKGVPGTGRRAPSERPARLAWATLGILTTLIGIEVAASLLVGFGRLPAHEWLLLNFAHIRPEVWRGEVWRVLTSTFLHGHLIHLAVNCAGIALFGISLERWLGSWRFLCIYLLSAIGGGIAFQAFSQGGTGVGASGGLCGLIAVFLIVLKARYRDGQLRLGPRFWIWFAALGLLLLFESFVQGMLFAGHEVADSAHFGGLFAGLAAGCYLLSPKGALGVGMRTRSLVGGVVVALVLIIYGGSFTVFDWSWYLYRVERNVASGQPDQDLISSLEERARHFGGDPAASEAILLATRGQRLDAALRMYEEHPPEDLGLRLLTGDYLSGALYAETGSGEDYFEMLGRLEALADERLAASDGEAQAFNHSAWIRALRAEDLDLPDRDRVLGTALGYAELAVHARPQEPSFVNTLGWVHFVRGDLVLGVRYLQEAADLAAGTGRVEGDEGARGAGLGDALRRAWNASWSRSGEQLVDPHLGSCYLYLARAVHGIGRFDEARRLTSVTRRLEAFLGPGERRLLEELEASL